MKNNNSKYGLSKSEIFFLIIAERLTNFINNEVLKENLTWKAILFLRVLPWISINIFLGMCAQPVTFYFIKFFLNLPKYMFFF
jgi:hypothetical protein